jgi:D-alanine-D-alanine ligase
MSTDKYRILLLVGGDSAEKDISFASGRSICEGLKQIGHTVRLADPGRPDIGPTEDTELMFKDTSISSRPPVIGENLYGSRARFLTMLSGLGRRVCDVVFNALHGGTGEDGTLQACLDYIGLPYTGSGALASALAMNKAVSKRLAAGAGVPVADDLILSRSDIGNPDIIKELEDGIGFPLVIKPNNQGSSVGVTVVDSAEALPGALAAAAGLDRLIIVERYIEGSELTVTILGEEALPIIEIRPRQGFYDYRNKYTDGSNEYLVPAPLDEKTTKAVQKSALDAYRRLGGQVYARVDFRLSRGGRHYYLETNTLPGMTANSLVPKSARAAGIDFPELLGRIIRLSLDK